LREGKDLDGHYPKNQLPVWACRNRTISEVGVLGYVMDIHKTDYTENRKETESIFIESASFIPVMIIRLPDRLKHF